MNRAWAILCGLLLASCAGSAANPATPRATSQQKGSKREAPVPASATTVRLSVRDVDRICDAVDKCALLCTQERVSRACANTAQAYSMGWHGATPDRIKMLEFTERECHLGEAGACHSAAFQIDSEYLIVKKDPDGQWRRRRFALLMAGCNLLDSSVVFDPRDTQDPVARKYEYERDCCIEAGDDLFLEDPVRAEQLYNRAQSKSSLEELRFYQLKVACQKKLPQGKDACLAALASILAVIAQNEEVVTGEPDMDEDGNYVDTWPTQEQRRILVTYVSCEGVQRAECKKLPPKDKLPPWPKIYRR